jgi:hypothetical protein
MPLLTSKRGRLHDDATLRKQLSGLTRVVKSGHEAVEHPRTSTAHDDVATAVCGALVQAAKASRHPVITADYMARVKNWHHHRAYGDDPRLSSETIYARQIRENARAEQEGDE